MIWLLTISAIEFDSAFMLTGVILPELCTFRTVATIVAQTGSGASGSTLWWREMTAGRYSVSNGRRPICPVGSAWGCHLRHPLDGQHCVDRDLDRRRIPGKCQAHRSSIPHCSLNPLKYYDSNDALRLSPFETSTFWLKSQLSNLPWHFQPIP